MLTMALTSHPKGVNVVLIACVVPKVNKLYLYPRVRTTMCTKMIFTRHIRTKVTFGSVGSGQPCSPRWVDQIQIRRIRIRIGPIERVRIQWIRWIGIPILPIEHAPKVLDHQSHLHKRKASRFSHEDTIRTSYRRRTVSFCLCFPSALSFFMVGQLGCVL